MKLYINIIAAVTFLFNSLGACFPLIGCLTHAVKMSSEVCPFCGKTYKRLKSHLPHCKAAARTRSPPTNQTTSSQLIGSSEPTATGETSLAESLKVSPVSSSPAATPTKKKKPKLSEQIKMAVTSLNSSSAPPPDISKPKKKSGRVLIEAAKSGHVTKGSLEGTKSASGNRPPPGSDPGEPIDVSKKKVPKTKRATQALSTTRDTDSDSLGSEISKSSTSPHMRNDFWVETEDSSTNKMLLKPGSSHQAKITIQDVKATLGRLSSQTLQAKVETLMADRKQNVPHGQTEGAVMRQSLGQVRLKELPEWLVRNTPGHPRDVVEMVRRGWYWYYRRYIDVRKGGVGGLGMLLAGYCVLSYIWSYPHLKRDRWRKYH
ncbi:hypothetical protein INR49_027277 [Caranx melampygus]|nr:hypothetical protein INR49_027277 [Caranx melampygus]